MGGCEGYRVWFLLCAVLTCACSDDADPPGSPGGTGGGGSGGQSGGGTGGSGATSTGGSAGSSGTSGATGCPDVEDFGADDIDVTLGGLNADLPAPSTDCLTVSADNTMCASLSAIVNGSAREIVCSSPSSSATNGSSLNCDTRAGESITVNTDGFAGKTAPTTFTLTLTEKMFGGPISLQLMEGYLSGNSSNFVEARLAGWVNKFEPSGRCKNTVWGVVAASWSAADAGAGEVRVRGSFHAREF